MYLKFLIQKLFKFWGVLVFYSDGLSLLTADASKRTKINKKRLGKTKHIFLQQNGFKVQSLSHYEEKRIKTTEKVAKRF